MRMVRLRTLFACSLFSLSLITFAQYAAEPSNIWLKRMPGDIKVDRIVPQWKKHEREGVIFTKVVNPTLEAFLPVTGTSNGQAVIVCPGGEYQVLTYEKEGQEVAQWLAKEGYNAYVLAYRVPENRLGALQDLQRAIRCLRYKGAEQVGVIGFSAGASLACRAATNWKQPSYKFLNQEIDTLSCRPDFIMLINPTYLDEGVWGTLSEDLHVDADTPAMFVFGSQDDVHYSGSSCKTLLKAMQEANASIEMHYLSKAGHGYGMREGSGLLWPTWAKMWLKGLK